MLPQLAVMIGLMILLEYGLHIPSGALLGAMVYLAIVSIVQRAVPHLHRRGLTLIRQGDYKQAAEMFEHSYKFFSERQWLDKYRAIFIFSVSKMSYREMALLNMAYCKVELKELTKAKELYSRTLQEFPQSRMAKDALAYLEEKTAGNEQLSEYQD